MRVILSFMPVLFLVAPAIAGDETPADKQYRAIVEEYEREGGARIFAPRFLEFAKQNAGDPAAVDALLWVVKNVRGKSDTTRALELLAKIHIESEKLGPACENIAGARSVAAEKLLRAAVEKNPYKNVRARACYQLASLLALQANIAEQLKAQPELAPRILQYYGKEYGEHLASLDAAGLTRQREQVLEQIVRSFADVPGEESTMGEFAERALFAIRHLSVGRPAPEIKGEDIFGKPFKLSDYRGKVVMLTFWGHWWGPCRELYPHERSLVKKMSGKPFVLLGVNSDEDRQALKKTLADERITWRNWWDEGRIDGPIHTTWQIDLRPSIHILDGKGVIRYKNIQSDEVDAAIEQLLGEL